MSKHPFRIVVENGANPDAFAKVLDSEVEIYAPMLSEPVRGRENVLRVLGGAAKTAHPMSYDFELRDNRQTFLVWHGIVSGIRIDAVTILVDNERGLTTQVRVLMRPWPVVTLFSDAMLKILSSQLPPDYWGLVTKGDIKDRPHTAIAMRPLEMTEDAVLHSPILAKSIKGRKLAETTMKATQLVLGAMTYTSIIATPDLSVELFDSDMDGHLVEGMWISKLNERGQVHDLTGYLRPYPVVSLMRDKVKRIVEQTVVRSSELETLWDLPETNR
jgi:hypothetical protein